MKTSILAAGFLAVAVSAAHARTWTSVDGSKTFEGDLRSYDSSTGQVTVLVNGRALEFSQDKLSEEDRTFLSEWEQSQAEAEAPRVDAESEIGSKVSKAKLHRLDGERFRRADWEESPKYYILYYSASW